MRSEMETERYRLSALEMRIARHDRRGVSVDQLCDDTDQPPNTRGQLGRRVAAPQP
jgi:hypothetical protein